MWHIPPFYQRKSERSGPAFFYNGWCTYWRLLVMLSVLVLWELMAADQSISRLINLSNSRAASTGCIFQSQCPDALLSGEFWLVSVVSRPKLSWEEIGASCRGKKLSLSIVQHYTQVKPGSHRILSPKRIHRYLIKFFVKYWNWRGLRLKKTHGLASIRTQTFLVPIYKL